MIDLTNFAESPERAISEVAIAGKTSDIQARKNALFTKTALQSMKIKWRHAITGGAPTMPLSYGHKVFEFRRFRS